MVTARQIRATVGARLAGETPSYPEQWQSLHGPESVARRHLFGHAPRLSGRTRTPERNVTWKVSASTCGSDGVDGGTREEGSLGRKKAGLGTPLRYQFEPFGTRRA